MGYANHHWYTHVARKRYVSFMIVMISGSFLLSPMKSCRRVSLCFCQSSSVTHGTRGSTVARLESTSSGILLVIVSAKPVVLALSQSSSPVAVEDVRCVRTIDK